LGDWEVLLKFMIAIPKSNYSEHITPTLRYMKKVSGSFQILHSNIY